MRARDARPRRTSGWQYRDWRGRSCPAALPQRLAEIRDDVEGRFACTDDDPGGAALRDAVTLARLLHGVGRTPTRVPEMADVSGELVEPRRRR